MAADTVLEKSGSCF